ncbi:MAG: hypothetical protein JXR49_13630 [Acidobacteria bacterium]|nr:hypothetical protein [Acidobacteriota bacterium]
MKVYVFALVLLLAAGIAYGADIDGKWTGKIAGMDGNEMDIGYTFKADGATLTGTTTGPDGAELAIKDGKIDGSNISFAVEMDFGGQAMTINYTGVVAGAQITLKMDFGMGEPMEIIIKKAQ